MASGNKTALGNFRAALVITTAAAASSFSFSTATTAQTVIIGGGNDRPVIVNYPPAPSAPYGQSVYSSTPGLTGSEPAGSDFTKGARIVSGDEVIVLTPPSEQKKKVKPAKKVAKKPAPKKVTAPKKTETVAKPATKKEMVKKQEAPKPKVTEAKNIAPAPTAPVKKAELPAPKKVAEKPAPTKKAVAEVKAPTPKPAPKPEVKPKPEAPATTEIAKAPEVKAPTKPLEAKPAPKKIAPAPKAEDTQVASLGKQSEVSAKTAKIPEIKPEVDKSAHQLIFEEGKTELPSNANALLKELSSTVGGTQDRIQLVAYAKASSIGRARRISLGRALAIREKLMNMGIPNNRIEVRALGAPDGDTPPDRVDLKIISR